MGVNPDIFWRPVKTCACFSWLPITAQPIMSINAAPSLNRHDPTNPHPVSVVSGWNPAEECPELTRISLGLSGITQAGEGLSMIASLGWGAVGVFVCSPVCACTLRWTCIKLWNIYMVLFVYMCTKLLKTLYMTWFLHLQQSAKRRGTVWHQIFPLWYDKVQHTDTFDISCCVELI